MQQKQPQSCTGIQTNVQTGAAQLGGHQRRQRAARSERPKSQDGAIVRPAYKRSDQVPAMET